MPRAAGGSSWRGHHISESGLVGLSLSGSFLTSRSRLLFEQCLGDGRVSVMGEVNDNRGRTSPALMLREGVGVVAGTTFAWANDRPEDGALLLAAPLEGLTSTVCESGELDVGERTLAVVAPLVETDEIRTVAHPVVGVEQRRSGRADATDARRRQDQRDADRPQGRSRPPRLHLYPEAYPQVE